MNASPVSVSSSASPAPAAAPAREEAAPATAVSASQTKAKARPGRSWIISLTGICFLFGGLLAMQLRTIQQVRANREQEKQTQVAQAQMVDQMRARADAAEEERQRANLQLAALKTKLAQNGSLTQGQIAALNAQIVSLQATAGLTPVQGEGVRMVLSDNPDAAKDAGETAFLPGIVHDYDLLQVVNELRAAKADAIAVRGAGGEPIRVTGYTPIRCVGPVIYINWQPVAAPFTVEAIGNSKTLRSALEMPGGIVDNLRTQGAIGVKIASVDTIRLPASTSGAAKIEAAPPVASSATASSKLAASTAARP